MRIIMQLIVLYALFLSAQGLTLSDVEMSRVISLLNGNKAELCARFSDGTLCKQSEKYGSLGPVLAFRFCRKTSSTCDKEIENFRDVIQLKGLKLATEGDVKSFLERAHIGGFCDFVADQLPQLKGQCLSKAPPRPSQPAPQMPKKN